MHLSFPATIEHETLDDGATAVTVTFRDVPEAVTNGPTEASALAEAVDALDAALSIYVDEGEPLPSPSPAREGEVCVAPSLGYALKLAVYQAMQQADVKPAELARRMGVDHKAISQRMLRRGHRTSAAQVEAALAALGGAVSLELHER